MKIKVGDKIAHECSSEDGIVVAITKEWVIIESDGCEYGYRQEEAGYWIPIDDHEEGGGQDGEIEVEESE